MSLDSCVAIYADRSKDQISNQISVEIGTMGSKNRQQIVWKQCSNHIVERHTFALADLNTAPITNIPRIGPFMHDVTVLVIFKIEYPILQF